MDHGPMPHPGRLVISLQPQQLCGYHSLMKHGLSPMTSLMVTHRLAISCHIKWRYFAMPQIGWLATHQRQGCFILVRHTSGAMPTTSARLLNF